MVLLRSLLRSLRIALVLMTTLPVRYPQDASAIESRRSIYFYPSVGFVIGLLLWLLASAANSASLFHAMLILALWILLTGALHLDGLADCADAWMGGLGDREKTLRILKDPLCGAIAVVALIVVSGLKLTAIQQLLRADSLLPLLFIPLLARFATLFLFWFFPYVREQGLGSALQIEPGDRNWFRMTIAIVVLAVLLCNGTDGLVWLTVAALVTLLVGYASKTRLGGFTGDVAGAQIELVECGLCVTAVLLSVN